MAWSSSRTSRAGKPKSSSISDGNPVAPWRWEAQRSAAHDRVRHEQREGIDVCLEEGDRADDGGKGDAVPDDRLEDVGLLADLVGGGGGDADRLSIDHLAHDAAGA